MEFVEILTTDVRYFYTGEAQKHDTEREGQDMVRREGVWASLIKDSLCSNNVSDGKNMCNSGTNNEVRGGKNKRNNNDVRDGNDTSNNDVRAPKWSSLREDVTMLSFDSCDIASTVCKFYKDLDYPSIPKVIAKVDDTTVVVEKIPQVPIMEWLESGQERRMWTVDSTGTQCLELEGRYSNIFRCIVATLSYLHSRDKCHGNLKRGIFVTGPTEKPPRVCFANFNVDIGFAEGFKKDLMDLKSLMKTAVEYSQPIKISEHVLPNPPALYAFYDLFREMNRFQIRDFAKFRDFATFIYWAPIFYNWRDRRDFLNIVDKFSLQDIRRFMSELVYDKPIRRKLEHAIPSMNDWANRVPSSSINPLREVYQFDNRCKVYENSGGIYRFHRNCLHHYVGTYGKDCDQRAMEDLLNVFPDALPAIFKALIDKFHNQNLPMFRKSLTTFLKEDKKEWRDNWS